MTLDPAPSAPRNPLDLCIDDAVSHAGVLMAELVARARKSLYEQAHRSGGPGEIAATAVQARQLLGDKAGFFEDEFPAALLAAMRQPSSAVPSELEPMLRLARQSLADPMAEFNLLASAALGLAPPRPDASPLTPESVVRAMQSLAVRTGAGDAVATLWMRHLYVALGPELADEYRRLSALMRSLAPGLDQTTAAAAATGRDVAEAAALMSLVARSEDPPVHAAQPGAAQRVAADVAAWPEMENVPDLVRDFVLGPWSEVIAQAEVSAGNAAGGALTDPDGYLALIRPLLWSAQPTLGRADNQRLMVTVPSLLSRLRSGLQSIGYPAEKASAFFRSLDDLHGIAARAAGSSFATRREPRNLSAPADGLLPAPLQPTAVASDENSGAPVTARVSPEAASQVLQPGAQLASWEGGRWVRWELTWASPKGKLLMFETEHGETDSMSRVGCIRRIVEQRMHVIPDISF